MRAVMVAAGLGTRLFGEVHEELPKVLLEFDGRSLLQRHVEILRDQGLDGLTLVTGYRADALEAELDVTGARDFVETLYNPDYRLGSVASLARASEVLAAGDPVLFFDADMLYHPGLVERMLASPRPNAFAFDSELEPGEDPVMICLDADGRIIDFGKERRGSWARAGEWPGLLRLDPDGARDLADRVTDAVDSGRAADPYEPSMRELILASAPERFGTVDVSDVPWIEIDFPDDLRRARREILPRLKDPLPPGESR